MDPLTLKKMQLAILQAQIDMAQRLSNAPPVNSVLGGAINAPVLTDTERAMNTQANQAPAIPQTSYGLLSSLMSLFSGKESFGPNRIGAATDQNNMWPKNP